MSLARRLTLALGVLAATAGLASALTGSAFGFGLDYLFVTLVGLLAVVQGLRYGAARRGADFEFTETGDPELRHEVPTPGEEFDAGLAASQGWSYRSMRERDEIHDRLREAAVESLVTHRELSRAEAERQVDEGEWIDDADAADVLATGSVRRGPRDVLRGLLRREPRYQYGVRRAVDEIDAIQRGER
jgi:hypothetical protein